MDFSWLPHWTTGTALGFGAACAFYSSIQPPSADSPDFKDKWVEGLPLLIGSIFIVLPMWVTGAIFLASGWNRSPCEWSVAGLGLFLWIPKSMCDQWFGESKGRQASAKPSEDPAATKSGDALR